MPGHFVRRGLALLALSFPLVACVSAQDAPPQAAGASGCRHGFHTEVNAANVKRRHIYGCRSDNDGFGREPADDAPGLRFRK